MNWLRLARARLIGLFRKEELEHEIDEELRFHVAMRTQENIARGMSPAEAARDAQRQFGNVDHIKDEWRDVSGGGWLESFVHDVRFAARMLAKDRAFTAVAVLALALGIGANTALFTVLSNVLLRPLPYPQAHAIMSISMRDSNNPQDAFPFSYPDFLDFRAATRVFERFGAFRSGSFVVRSNGGDAVRVQGARVTADILPLVGVKPAIGRVFLREEEEPGRRTVIISHAMWEKHFARAANITDASLTVNGREHSIVGVMPADFRFPVQNEPAEFWMTFATELEPLADGAPSYPLRRDSHFLRVLGRLRPGFTPEQADAELDAIAKGLAEKYPDTNRLYDGCHALPWLAQITRDVRPMLLMLIGAAFFTLCVACANVANLLLARASTRGKEIAIRAALGAGRRRIFRQLLTESLLLAAIGGLAGLLLALAATHYIVAALPSDFPRASDIRPDGHVLAFTLFVTGLTTCMFGVAPGWRCAATKLVPLLSDVGAEFSDAPGGRRARSVLVVAEMVLAFVLLAGATFFITNLAHLQSSPLGFEPGNVVTLNLFIPDDKDPALARRTAAFAEALVPAVAQQRGVHSASVISRLPLTDTFTVADFEIAGRAIPVAELPLAEPHITSPGYFRTMQIPVKRGRDFDNRDTRESAPVAIVNQTLAQRYFPGEDPIGKRITPGLFSDPAGPLEREIIGVVGDVPASVVGDVRLPQFYLPLAQYMWLDLMLVVRTDLAPDDLLRTVDRIVTNVDPNVALGSLTTMEQRVAGAVATPRLNSTLLAAFATVAVVLTAIGVYGVMAYSVAQRRHEIGIRLAVGASAPEVFRLVLREGIRLIVYALVLGAALTLLMFPALRALVHGPVANHATIVSLAALLLGCVALMACWIPARRAAVVDPLSALGQR
jgi:predicted permease